MEDFLNAAMEGEQDSHLQETKPVTKNRRNGKMSKTLQTEYGQIEVETPRDRDTDVQLCIVHQIRNSVKYVGSKNQKEFLADLKCVYAALTKDATELALDKLEEKWGELYPIVIKSWRDKWENLSHYFQYTADIRRIIYTTNIVEGYHRQVRKVTKTKGVFPSDDAVFKLVWLAYRNIKKKWTMPISNWGQTAQQLAIAFEGRFQIL